MAVSDDIAAIRGRTDIDDREKQRLVYALKCGSLAEILNNGRPPPNPIPPAVNRTYTLNGVDYTLTLARDTTMTATDGTIHALRIAGRAVKDGVTKRFDFMIVNPPVLARDRRDDLIAAASEMIEALVTWP